MANKRGKPARHDPPLPSDLDGLIHERLRLGIVSALAVREEVSFTELKALLGATDGNLSVQARKLEEAGYVACNKRFEKRRPKTVFRLAPKGRRALGSYLNTLERLLPPRAAAAPSARRAVGGASEQGTSPQPA